jgi:hypothetical protein
MTDETTRPLPDDGDEPTRSLPLDGDDTSSPFQEDGGETTGPFQEDVWRPPYEEDTGGRHPLSVAHLVAGLVFLGIATSWLLRETGVVDSEATGWFLPLTLVVAGAIGLLAWFSSARGKTR